MTFDGLIFFFLMLLIGYGVVRLRMVPVSAADGVSGVLLNICYPAMVLNTFLSTEPELLLHTGLPAALATLIVTLLLFFGSLLVLRRQPPSRRAYWCFISGIGNVAFVAIPLMSIFLPPEAMVVCFIHGAMQDFLIWSIYHSLFLGSAAGGRRALLRGVLTSPALLAAIAGSLLSAFRLRLPGFLELTVSKISDMTSPLALLLLGMLLYRYGALSWRRDKAAMAFSAGKVLVLPLLLFWPLRCFLELRSALLLALLFGSPAPITGVVWCKEYGGDTELAVHCTIASTLLYLLAASAALLTLTSLGLLA